MQTRVYCLYRVSTVKQVDFNDANEPDLPMQRNACHAFADRMGWSIIHEEQETGVSGSKVSADRRDKLQLIKKRAAQGEFDVLLVFMFDRIGRKADETPFVVEWFARNGIRVWSVQEGEQRFDSHVDTLLNYIRFWQADGESQKTSVRTKEGMRQLVLSGGYRGGTVPYGYRLEPTGKFNKRKREISKLIIDENEAAVVRKIFELCVSHGFGRLRTAIELNRLGFRNRKGETWKEATIAHILHNQTYIGMLHSGETISVPFGELAIVDRDIFNHAQQILIDRQCEQHSVPMNTKGRALLSGNVFCGHCGGRLVLTTNGKTVYLASGEKKGVKRIRYICYNKSRKNCECEGQTGYTSHILDELVDSVVRELLDQLGFVDGKRLLSDIHLRSERQLNEKIRLASQRLREVEEEYELLKPEILKTLKGAGEFPVELLSNMVWEAQEKIQCTEMQLNLLKSERKLSRDRANTDLKHFKNVKWGDLYEKSSPEVKKMIVNYLIRRIDVFRGYSICIEVNSLIAVM